MATYLKTTDLSTDGARTLPGEYYTSPDVLAQEMGRIFRRRWLCIGREDQIPNAGDYVLQAVGKDNVIVLRDKSGGVRAYHNVCRHRGTRLCEEHTGRFSETIQCPYHAWTYSLDGRLIGAPSTNDLDGFDKADYPLLQVASAVWEGFLFINLAEEPEPFEHAWAPLLGKFSRFNMPNLKVGRTHRVRRQGELEAAAAELLRVLPLRAGASGAGQDHAAHERRERPDRGAVHGWLHDHRARGGKPDDERQGVRRAGGELPEEDMTRVYYYAIFPNMLLSLHPDYVMFHTLWPEGTDRTRIFCSWLFHPATLSDPTFNPDDGVEFWDMTNKQDWHICEQSQLGVESPAYRPGPYSKREAISVQIDREVLRSLKP